MDNITYIFQIYKSCDPGNTNSVPVSSLLNFIKPFMSDDLNELEQLRAQLDPDGKDPAIDSDFFHAIMSDWIAKIDKQEGGKGLSNMTKSMGVGEVSLSLTHSAVFTNGLSPNTSKLADTSNNNIIALEEQIQKLQHQLHKTTKELDLVKQQLACSEEQNESLSQELNKLHKLQSREQQIHEENAKNKLENEEIKEEATAASKKIQQLEKVVAHLEKQNRNLADEVNQFENENGCLKLKVQKLEKGRSDTMKTISDLEDVVESKDAEIATLLEVIDELKCKFDEKSDLASFYMNENKLSKQKAEALENLLNEMFPEEVFSPQTAEAAVGPAIYNSPKLLNQLSHPITPTMDSPICFKKCSTSSPIKNLNTAADFFSSASIVTVLRSPHKTLKEELSEVSNKKIDNQHEIEHLKGVLKDQKMVTDDLWDNMRRLSQDNESLREYKQGFQDLAYTLQEKDEIIEQLENEVSTFKIKSEASCIKEDKCIETDFWQERDELVQYLNEKLHQQNVSSDVKKLEENNIKLDKCVETDVDNELINLKNEVQVLRANLEVEKSNNISQRKELSDKCIGTDKDQIVWNIPISNVPDSKKTNYSKQQMKLERLLEKQEKLEKELMSERRVNRTLRSQVEQLREENIVFKENLGLAEHTRNQLSEKIKVLETEQRNLQQENTNLANEKFTLEQILQTKLNELGVEKSVTEELLEKETVLLKKIREFEIRTRQECKKELFLRKQIIDLKATHDLEVTQLRKDLLEKESVIFNLQNENISVEGCLIMLNEKITCAISHILTQFELNDELDKALLEASEIEYELQGTSVLIKQTNMLKGNVKSALQVLKIIERKYLLTFDVQEVETPLLSETYNVSQSVTSSSIDEFFDSRIDTPPNSIEEDDSFITCFSELSNEECLDVITFESDSFLDNLELNDWDVRNLSHKDMEDKFTTLALTLTVDFTTLNRRYLNQRDKCNQLFIKFFTYLNCIMDLVRQLKPNDQAKADKTTKLLKSLSEEIFTSAFQCGVIQYEKRTVSCWKFVIKYVAALSQESREFKKYKNQGSGEVPNIAKTSTSVHLCSEIKCTDRNELLIQPRSDPWKKFKCYIVTFFLFIFVLFMVVMFYVDYLCLRNGKRVCPVEWLFSLLVKRVRSHHLW